MVDATIVSTPLAMQVLGSEAIGFWLCRSATARFSRPSGRLEVAFGGLEAPDREMLE